MAARSPDRSSAGPLVIRKPTPISAATIPASVVFPRPGRAGEEEVVGGLAPLAGGAEDDLEVLPQRRLADELGQTAGPQRRLLGLLGRRWLRPGAVPHARAFRSRWRPPDGGERPVDGQQLEGLLQQHLDRPVVGQARRARSGPPRCRSRGLRERPAPPPGRSAPPSTPVEVGAGGAELGGQLDHEPLGGALPDPGHEGEGVEVALDDRPPQGGGRVDREDGQRQLRPDPGGAHQRLEGVALLPVGEAVEAHGVFPHDQVGEEEGRPARFEGGHGTRRHRHPVADTADLDEHLPTDRPIEDRPPQ